MTFLPLMASYIGLSQTVIGISGSVYFAGFILGAVVTPRIIAKVGHSRSFTTLMAVFLRCFQILPMTDSGVMWILVRFLQGAVMCGAYTVVESWLSNQADASTRGSVRGIYTVVILGAMVLGQGLLSMTYSEAAQIFAPISILIGCAIIPVSFNQLIGTGTGTRHTHQLCEALSALAHRIRRCAGVRAHHWYFLDLGCNTRCQCDRQHRLRAYVCSREHFRWCPGSVNHRHCL